MNDKTGVGVLEGRKEGLLEGEKMAMIQVARDMLKRGFDLDTIANITKLTPKEIEQLRN